MPSEAAEQHETPETEDRDEQERQLVVVVDVVDAARRQDERRDDQHADGDRAAETHAEPGDGAVHAEIALVPFVLDRARRIEQEEVGRDRRAEDADGDEPVARRVVAGQARHRAGDDVPSSRAAASRRATTKQSVTRPSIETPFSMRPKVPFQRSSQATSATGSAHH